MYLGDKIEKIRYVAVNYCVKQANQTVAYLLQRETKQRDTSDVCTI